MNRFANFMVGRYGMDQLNAGLIVLYLILALVLQFTGIYWLTLLALVPLIFCFYRFFSRNINKRYQENSRFLSVWNPVKQWFCHQKRRWSDRKTHRYYHCPRCKNILRVPKGKGKICITCPVCKTEFIKKT